MHFTFTYSLSDSFLCRFEFLTYEFQTFMSEELLIFMLLATITLQ